MDPSILHLWEKEEDGDIVETKATSGENDATATVNVRSVVHVAAYITSGHEVVSRKRIKLGSQKNIMVGKSGM